jgi:hypothetical protein
MVRAVIAEHGRVHPLLALPSVISRPARRFAIIRRPWPEWHR